MNAECQRVREIGRIAGCRVTVTAKKVVLDAPSPKELVQALGVDERCREFTAVVQSVLRTQGSYFKLMQEERRVAHHLLVMWKAKRVACIHISIVVPGLFDNLLMSNRVRAEIAKEVRAINLEPLVAEVRKHAEHGQHDKEWLIKMALWILGWCLAATIVPALISFVWSISFRGIGVVVGGAIVLGTFCRACWTK